MAQRRRPPPDGPDPDDPARQRDPDAVSELIAVLTSERGWSRRLQGARIHEAWDEIAGPSLAPHVVPVRLHGGVLVVRVESAAWATQMRYLSGDLVERANEVLGEGTVQQVTVTTADRADHRRR